MAPNATYLQRGEALDYTNDTEQTIPHGTVITVGTHIGVTGCDIPPHKIGTLHMVGVFRINKTGSAAVKLGQPAYFDGTGITDEANGDTNIEVGYFAAPAEASDETVLVKING